MTRIRQVTIWAGLFFLLMALTHCDTPANEVQPPRTEPTATPEPTRVIPHISEETIAADRLAIYQLAIDTNEYGRADTFFVIHHAAVSYTKFFIQKGGLDFRDFPNIAPTWQRRVMGLKQDTWRNFLSQNEHPAFLEDKFVLSHPHQLISDEDLIISSEEWNQLQEQSLSFTDWFEGRYPGATGYFYLSQIGFNQAHDQALVYVRYWCEGLCGMADIVFLVKEEDKWIVKETMRLWRS